MGRDLKYEPYVAHLRGWESERVIAAKEAIEGLLAHPGWDVLTGLLEDARDASQARLRYGGVLEQAEYAKALGHLLGLEGPELAAQAVVLYAKQVEEELKANAETAGVE